MSARIFVHPRCWDGPASGALAAALEAHGVDLDKVRVGPLGLRRQRELVREIGVNGAVTTYERMDGTRYDYRMGQVAPEPEAA